MRLPSLAADLVRNRCGGRTWPRFLTYIVTFACNARCVMCDSWRKPSPGDLTAVELDGILRQLPPMDAVRLSGGEPFVRPDLTELAGLVADHLAPRVLHVTTNGFLTDRIIAFCERRRSGPALRLLVSIDGLRETHNRIRGRESAFDAAMATIRALAPRRRELGLHLSVNQTIVDDAGVEEYRRLRDLLHPLGVRNQAVLAYAASATYGLAAGANLAPARGDRYPGFSTFDPGAVERLVEEGWEDAAALPWGERWARRYYLAGIRARVVEGQAWPNPPCVALNSHLRLLPNGDVPTCQFNGKVVGNLRRQSFREVWFGSVASAARSWVRSCPGCWAECEVLPSAIYTGDLLRSIVASRPRGARRAGTFQEEAGTGAGTESALPG